MWLYEHWGNVAIGIISQYWKGYLGFLGPCLDPPFIVRLVRSLALINCTKAKPGTLPKIIWLCRGGSETHVLEKSRCQFSARWMRRLQGSAHLPRKGGIWPTNCAYCPGRLASSLLTNGPLPERKFRKSNRKYSVDTMQTPCMESNLPFGSRLKKQTRNPKQ